ncbi:MAG: hypothetical protein SGJ18_14430 [Pseudomonadota bacterium]|nr:hypothetical protein [Pseudomonadota bacterium]
MFRTFLILGMLLVSQVGLADDKNFIDVEPANQTVAANADGCPPHNITVGLEKNTNTGNTPAPGKTTPGTGKNDLEIKRMPIQFDEAQVMVAVHNDPFSRPCQ